ncbi:MAG TPA: sulfite exporter TauE/SafE family protein [Stellaceae bacterium]|nr:sulfite exporter TauE/SafE family protein [Stellaceae bacterium]
MLVAGAVSGISGLAFPLIAGPIFLLLYPAPEAVALTAMCSLTGQLFSIALLRRVIGYEFRIPLIGAGLLGAPLGSALLCSFNPHCARVVLGALIVISGSWRMLRANTRTAGTRSLLAEVLVGLTGGLTGGLVGASSVVPAIWCAACGFDKSRQRAVTQPYILAMQAASLVSLWAWGALDRDILVQYANFVLPVLVGVGLGVTGFRGLSSSAATRVVLGVVTASGCALLFF